LIKASIIPIQQHILNFLDLGSQDGFFLGIGDLSTSIGLEDILEGIYLLYAYSDLGDVLESPYPMAPTLIRYSYFGVIILEALELSIDTSLPSHCIMEIDLLFHLQLDFLLPSGRHVVCS
jgi:hypothetical protein